MILGRMLKRTATRWPDSEAVIQKERRLTYRELFDTVSHFANGLRSLGIKDGDTVGIFAANCIEQIVSYLAIQSIGAVAVPVNPRLSARELSAILTDAEARVLVCDADRADTVVDASADLPTIEHHIAAGGTNKVRAFDEVLADGDAEFPDADIHPDDPALMMHTSGTTGNPKLVVISHQSQIVNSLSCAVELNVAHDDRALHIAPLYHSAGYLNLFLPCLQLGATHVIEPMFSPERTLERIEDERITVSLGVPTHFQKLRQADVDAATFDTNSLRLLLTSGAPIHQQTIKWIVDHLCPNLRNVYGLTESTGLVTATGGPPHEESDVYCIGEPFLDAEIRLIEVDEDVGPDWVVESGERGQLIVRSAKLMDEYYGQPKETADALREGWLYTGDVAVERDGIYYLIDRIDNRIISGGENIYPQEIERILDDHPAVEDCAISGEPDPTLGEQVVAYVVPNDSSLSLANIDEYWKDQADIADFKRPRDLRFVESIPRNQSGKILRNKLPEAAD